MHDAHIHSVYRLYTSLPSIEKFGEEAKIQWKFTLATVHLHGLRHVVDFNVTFAPLRPNVTIYVDIGHCVCMCGDPSVCCGVQGCSQ